MMNAVYCLADLEAAVQQKQQGTVSEESIFFRQEKPARLAVIGHPISHSKSPQMHQSALDALGVNASYIRVELVDKAEFDRGLRCLKELGFIGCNVTIPHKENAARYALNERGEIQSPDTLVKTFGVSNTIQFCDHTTFNTDAYGFQRAVEEEFGVMISSLNILVLGASGGAGRVISYMCGLATQKTNQTLYLANRTFSKVEAFVQNEMSQFQPAALSLEQLSLLDSEQVDLVVNATSLGLKETDDSPLPDGFLKSHHLVYDTTYGCENALFRQADKAGARYTSGLSMLIHQGAVAFEKWFPDLSSPLGFLKRAMK